MKQINTGLKDFGEALYTDAISLPPFVGNAVRAALAVDLKVDYFNPKGFNDNLYLVGTIASFIPVATIIVTKEWIKKKRAGG